MTLSITAQSLWSFVTLQSHAKSNVSYLQSAEDARKFVEENDSTTLAKKVGHLPFPYETFDPVRVQAMCQALNGGMDKHAKLIIGAQIIAEEAGDKKRSHMIVNGERWAANHSYPKYWKPLIVLDQTAVIMNPSGPSHPGRLVDHFTNERFNSSVVRTNYVSPVEAWKKELPAVIRRLFTNIKYEADKMRQEGLPYSYKPITEADLREACLDEFPCSYHFPPTALHATLYFLNELTPEVFTDGCRMLDTSAGHGHRLIGAITCPLITYMAATDPNKKMQDAYQRIMKGDGTSWNYRTQFVSYRPSNEPAQDAVEGQVDKNEVSRKYIVWDGRAEDPNNQVYKVDKLFNLVFSSPPFFNTEAYGDDKNQATHSYETFEKWVSGFLEPMLNNSWSVLEKGGYLALNLTDAHTNQCVEALMDIVIDKLKGEYLGMIPSRKAIGTARWTSKEDRTVTIKHGIDPIWVFRK